MITHMSRITTGFAVMILAACQTEAGANEQDERSAQKSASKEQYAEFNADREPDIVSDSEPMPGVDLSYHESEMQTAFSSVFKTGLLSAVTYLPQMTSFGPTGKTIPFSVAPLAFEWTDDGAVLITAAVSENESASLIPGSDIYYIGVYYLRPYNLGFQVKASYPIALEYVGSALPVVSKRFTGEPLLVARGLGSFTWMGASRYWDELYALEGGEPELIGIVPLSCGETDSKDNDRYDKTSGSITEVLPKKGFIVKYRGDVSATAKWEYRDGKFVVTAPYPDLCEHDYIGSIRDAKAAKPLLKGGTAGAR